MPKVVVGVDGSEGGRRALEAAVAEAVGRNARLEVVGSWEPASDAFSTRAPGGSNRLFRTAMMEELEAALEKVGSTLRDALVRPLALPAGPGLVEAALDADLLVVGSRGHGSGRSLLLGSTSEHCVHHARCPVLVVRRHLPRTGCRVGAGLEGPEAHVVLRAALDEVRLRRGTIEVIRACPDPSVLRWAYPPPLTPREADPAAARRALDEITAGAARRDERGLIIRTVVTGEASSALERVSARLDLLVVGAHARSPLTARLLGSVSTHLVHEAACSVLVVRAATPARGRHPIAAPAGGAREDGAAWTR
jgi:nucleotide-binding universal stress UspA family protein